jgi:hypothetical protein
VAGLITYLEQKERKRCQQFLNIKSVYPGLLIIWYSKFSIEMLQSDPQILGALRLEDQ